MKLYTVIEIPDEDYKLSNKWAIDTDGEIICLNEDGDVWLHYKTPLFDYELRPFPTKKVPVFDPDHCDEDEERKIYHEIVGYNRCVYEMETGEGGTE